MRAGTFLLAVGSAGALVLSGCSSNSDTDSDAAEGTPSDASGSSTQTEDATTTDSVVKKEIGQEGGAYCTVESDSDDPDDWGCAVSFAVTDLKVGSTCQELGYEAQSSFSEPDNLMVRIDADLEFAPDATEQETIFGGATEWDVVTLDGITIPLNSSSACYGDGGYESNNTWNSSSQAGRKYQRTSLFELPEGASTLVLSSLQGPMEWEWDLSKVSGTDGDSADGDGTPLSGSEPQPTTAGA